MGGGKRKGLALGEGELKFIMMNVARPVKRAGNPCGKITHLIQNIDILKGPNHLTGSGHHVWQW